MENLGSNSLNLNGHNRPLQEANPDKINPEKQLDSLKNQFLEKETKKNISREP